MRLCHWFNHWSIYCRDNDGCIWKQHLIQFRHLSRSRLIAFTIYRMSARQALPVDEYESFVMHTPASIHEELDPRTITRTLLYVEEVVQEVRNWRKIIRVKPSPSFASFQTKPRMDSLSRRTSYSIRKY